MARELHKSTKRPPHLQFKSTFQEWLEKNLQDPGAIPAIKIGTTGFQNAEVLRQFMLSNVGQVFLNENRRQFDEKLFIQNQLKIDAIESELFKQIILGALLRAYMNGEDAKAEKIRRYAIELNHQILSENQAVISANHTPKPDDAPRGPSEGLMSTLQILEGIQNNIEEREKLEQKLALAQHQQQLMLAKHDQFNQAMAIFDTQDGHLDGLDVFATRDLDRRVQWYTKDSKWITDRLQDGVSEKLYVDANGKTVTDLKKAELVLSKGKKVVVNDGVGYILKDSQELDDLTEHEKKAAKNSYREVQQYTRQLKLNELKLEVLRDLIDVLNGDKFYVDAEGKPVQPPKDIKQAELVLAKGQKVVVKDGKGYLLKAGQEFDSLTQDEKETANNSYQEAQHYMKQFKVLVAMHKREIELDLGATDLAILIEDHAMKAPKGHHGGLDDNLVRVRDQQQTLNLELGHLFDMLAVLQGLKYFANKSGKRVPYGEESVYIIDVSQQPVLVNGQLYAIDKSEEILEDTNENRFYLVPKGTTLEMLKNEPEAQKRAERSFERLKYDPSSTVKKLVKDNNALEVSFMEGEISRHASDLANNLQVGKELSQSLAPRPTPRPSSPRKDDLMALRRGEQPALTYDDFSHCQGRLEPKARDAYLQLLEQAPRFGPIPPELQRKIMNFLDKHHVNPFERTFNPTPFNNPYQ
ncbi:hypothetical protein [Legionella waltersii]|uniref:Dot/Icm system substrate protein LidA n=1 Tax=Legionella waltersii TaxID=66969 RepID=A0A0W1ANU6_9GAMM|nr:hypothetical protein [Legionella waltersii]KTD83019.1 Dot/Icm system substrate protein LidA [Legionella waltersii]SNV07670.1 Dot/Icm system substrate protein LidA [Legionella waltersii]